MASNHKRSNGVCGSVTNLQIAKALAFAEVSHYGSFELDEVWDDLAPDNRRYYQQLARRFRGAINTIKEMS
jgi:hypothetical protein